MPKVSVIVPVYNTEKYLPECIDSIINQSYLNLEIILINDGSTDNSSKICDEYASKDKRIIVIHKANGGQADARNAGLDIANGKYITFIDSDDYYSDLNTLKYCIAELEQDKSICFVEFPVEHPDQNSKRTNAIFNGKEEIYKAWYESKIVKTYFCDKVLRSEIMGNIRFPKGMIFEDRFLFPILINSCNRVSIISNGCYYYRQHQNQTTRRDKDSYYLIGMILSDINILNNMPSGLKNIYAVLYYRIVSNLLILGNNKNIILPPLNLSIQDLWSNKITIGIRLRLSFFKLFGFKFYSIIFK